MESLGVSISFPDDDKENIKVGQMYRRINENPFEGNDNICRVLDVQNGYVLYEYCNDGDTVWKENSIAVSIFLTDNMHLIKE